VTETSNVQGDGVPSKPERTVTVTGLPILLTGLAAIFGFKWLRRRRQLE
jgi:hypothetical protein